MAPSIQGRAPFRALSRPYATSTHTVKKDARAYLARPSWTQRAYSTDAEEARVRYPSRLGHLATRPVVVNRLVPTYAKAHQVDEQEASQRLTRALAGPLW